MPLVIDGAKSGQGVSGSGTVDHLSDIPDRPHSQLTGVTVDQHHAKSHAHDGADGSGAVDHDDVTNVSADQHHDQAHAHDGDDDSGTVDHSNLDGVTADQHHAKS